MRVWGNVYPIWKLLDHIANLDYLSARQPPHTYLVDSWLGVNILVCPNVYSLTSLYANHGSKNFFPFDYLSIRSAKGNHKSWLPVYCFDIIVARVHDITILVLSKRNTQMYVNKVTTTIANACNNSEL
jgi:hypothetical protein